MLLVAADRVSVGFEALRDEVRLPGGLVSSKVGGFAEIGGRLRCNAFAAALFDRRPEDACARSVDGHAPGAISRQAVGVPHWRSAPFLAEEVQV